VVDGIEGGAEVKEDEDGEGTRRFVEVIVVKVRF
jgi:hypothetical protein